MFSIDLPITFAGYCGYAGEYDGHEFRVLIDGLPGRDFWKLDQQSIKLTLHSVNIECFRWLTSQIEDFLINGYVPRAEILQTLKTENTPVRYETSKEDAGYHDESDIITTVFNDADNVIAIDCHLRIGYSAPAEAPQQRR